MYRNNDINPEERLNLQKLVKEYGADDTTKKIRTLKHSKLIKQDVERLLELKRKYVRMDKKTL